jgi:predicted RNA binding protein YcfA (HicA-like mRNA interferase family)
MKPEIWDQIKNITADEIIKVLEKDGWTLRLNRSSRFTYLKDKKIVSIHYHPHKNYGHDLIKDLFQEIGWTEGDLKRLKLIK